MSSEPSAEVPLPTSIPRTQTSAVAPHEKNRKPAAPT